MTAIEFGSPEANAVLRRDKQIEENEADGVHYVVFKSNEGYGDDVGFEDENTAVSMARDLSNDYTVYVVAQVSDDETDDQMEIVALAYGREVFYA